MGLKWKNQKQNRGGTLAQYLGLNGGHVSGTQGSNEVTYADPEDAEYDTLADNEAIHVDPLTVKSNLEKRNELLPTNNGAYANAPSTHDQSCPARKDFARMLDNQFKNGRCMNGKEIPKLNQLWLKRASMIKPGGGYDYVNGPPTNQDINICGDLIHKGGGSSHCSGSGYSVLIPGLDEIGYFKNSGLCTLGKDKLKKYFSTDSKLYNTLNNSKVQMGNLAEDLGLGSEVSSDPKELANACPGDFVSFSRRLKRNSKKWYGHQGLLAGIHNGKMYFWSAQTATKGWGIDCQDISGISKVDFAVTRVNNPKNIVNVLSTEDKKMMQKSLRSFDYEFPNPYSPSRRDIKGKTHLNDDGWS